MNKTIISPEERVALAKRIHANAVSKGFWDGSPSVYHHLMLVITELSEAVEAHRKDHWADRELFEIDGGDREAFERYIKSSVEDELADAYIRLLDLSEHILGMVFVEEEETSYIPYQNLSFTESIFYLTRILSSDICDKSLIRRAVDYLDGFCLYLGIDLAWHVKAKVVYNEARPRLHGKKY